MTDHKDIQVFWGGISAGAEKTTSVTGGIAAFGGYSIQNGFTPNRNINVAEATLATLATNLATLVLDLMGPQRG